MHVSSKLAFHLSDSFYHAIRNVDAVALELNPEIWQGQMVRLDKLQQNYRDFTQSPTSDLLNERSFQLRNYETELKSALSSEPTIVNSLLYRSYKAREDFEEDTFLDLYIFQTGKKLGKRATGVENYFETERLILEAYSDMGKEKKRRTVDTDGQSMYEIEQKSQDAYRRGDLDLLDSLDRMMERSDAFREKFLYKRNEIQANSIDTILKKSSLFVGVGAAHLAGERGVIDLLRKKGYRLRPVFMVDRDATQKEAIDKMKVPVHFTSIKSSDGFITMETPGPLYKMSNDHAALDRLQYSDMSNGSYYLLTRVKTHSGFFGHTTEKVMKKVDSMLYENIPGRIIKRSNIVKNGYKGYDIINRTRRGDLQRYNIIVTPYEVLVFKLGGKESYIEGPEATRFFNSIKLKEPEVGWQSFTPSQGGFKIELPSRPHEKLAQSADGLGRWEYESVDPKSGDAYLLFKKSLHNYSFIEEDTFDLALVEQSFSLSPLIEKQTSRKLHSMNGRPVLDAKFSLKDGGTLTSRFMTFGPHYYVLAVKSKQQNDPSRFYNSFSVTPFKYGQEQVFVDTFLHYSVKTPVVPELEESLRAMVEKLGEEGSYGSSGKFSYWPKTRTALFKADSTGEQIVVAVQQFPKYFHAKDSADFWKDEIEDYVSRTDMVLRSKESFRLSNGVLGYKLVLSDTNSTRIVNRVLLLKGDRIYRIVSSRDSSERESYFVNSFYSTLTPTESKASSSIFTSKLDNFVLDLFSSDSTTRSRAEDAISNVYYGEKGIPTLLNLISRMQFGSRQYFENKSKLIAELGYIREPGAAKTVVGALKQIFEAAGDTSTFQNEVFRALAKHRSKEAYELLKELLVEDPPVFENSYDYGGFFHDLEDSLQLTRTLLPELMQLSTIDDYKDRVNGLMVKMIDSGYLKARDYESFYNKIYFDARIQLKKQLGKDEKILQQENDDDDDDRRYYDYNSYSKNETGLEDYTTLLLPFYDKKPAVQKFFDKLLTSRDPLVQLRTVTGLLRFNKSVPDSVINKLAASDKMRAQLYKAMETAGALNKFPAKYKSQLQIAKSHLIYDKMDSVEFVGKRQLNFRGEDGVVYFFKYRIKKEDEWKIGISGLQPVDESKINTDDKLTKLTDKRLRDDEPVIDQFNEQLKRLLFSFRKSAKSFYADGYSSYNDD
jgi:uncharacterized protein YbaP (TraB family)